MKNYLKILSLITLFIFSSCEKDLYEDGIKNSERGLHFKSVTYGEIKATNTRVSNSIEKLETNLNPDIQARTTDLYGFVVDTSYVMYLEKENGFKSYSFKILQDESLNYFKNLIVSDFIDGTIGVEVIKFNLDKSLEQVKVEGNLKESIISREVSRLSNTTNNFVRYDCITVGYYTTLDRCEGELVTPEERPECFNADGTRAMKEVFVTLAEECGFEGSGGTSYDGITVGDPHSGIENGGGGYYSGIFIPNPFEGEPDLNNASFVLAGKISTYLNGLKSNNVSVKNLLNSHYWIYPLIVQFVNENSPNGSFTEELKQTVTFALENATQGFNLNSQYWSFAEINQYKYNAFLTLLKNPNPSTVAAQQQVIDFFNNNPDANVSVEFANEVLDLANNETNQEDVNKLVNLTFLVERSGTSLFTDEFALSLDQFIDLDLGNPPSTLEPNLLGIKIYLDYRRLRNLNPEWSRSKCIWEATKGVVHLSLDVFGLIPVGGEVADLINGVLYTIEGEKLDATLSYASAIPIVGWVTTGTKFGLKVVTTASGSVKLVWKVVGEVIQFGDRGQLRKVLGLLPGNPLQAHHLIPWSSQTKMAVQRAAKFDNAFHMNEALNGIPVAAWRNQPNHQAYNDLINSKLDEFRDDFPNATPDQCYTFLTNLIDQIRTWVINNPNKHLNEIILP